MLHIFTLIIYSDDFRYPRSYLPEAGQPVTVFCLEFRPTTTEVGGNFVEVSEEEQNKNRETSREHSNIQWKLNWNTLSVVHTTRV